MKIQLLAAVAAISLTGLAPALAQTAAPAASDHQMAMQPMTRAEMTQKVQQHFAMVDTNHDGVVNQAEADAAKAAMHAKMGERMQARHAQRFDNLDSNNDGSVSRQEFDSAHSQQQKVAQDGGAATGGMHRMGGMRHMAGMRHDMFKMADLNKDGQVTLQEATQAALQHFDSMDSNRDGTISPDEMRAMHMKMRSMRAGS